MFRCRAECKTITKPPIVPESIRNIDFKQLGKQIASISPLLIGGVDATSGVSGSSGQRSSAQFTPIINQIASLKGPQNTPITNESIPSSALPQASNIEKVDELIGLAISRSQVFLNNDKARAALGGSSLQIFVYALDVQNKSNHVAAFYMDSDIGKSERGVMETKKPSATVHINKANLKETLEGRFDLLEAMKKSEIRFEGSLIALSKLRFLLQFK